MGLRVYVETGTRRVFAGALEWPGWCRGGRDQASALDALIAYGPRYKRAMKRAASGLVLPEDAADLDVVERVKGNATTDFGAPAVAPKADRAALSDDEIERLKRLQSGAWSALDRSARAAAGATLTKGPRGGGRDLDAIVAHVFEADRAYLGGLGGTFRVGKEDSVESPTRGLRKAFLDAIVARARGETRPSGRRKAPLWTPAYAVRRSAWHALDHAWEIEDRAKAGR